MLTEMMFVSNISMHHDLRLIVSIRVNRNRPVVTVRHMRPDGSAQRIDLRVALGLLVVHGELAIGREERGVLSVRVGRVGDFVVFFEEIFDGGVLDGIGEIWQLIGHFWVEIDELRVWVDEMIMGP